MGIKLKLSLFISLFIFIETTHFVEAADASKLGIHILNTSELAPAEQLLSVDGSNEWRYVTIPYTLADVEKPEQWQDFFDEAHEKKITPLVRLATKMEDGGWTVPSRYDAVQLVTGLSKLDWHADKKHIIVFNEVNHAKEWGGSIDPKHYAEVLEFVSNWARTENKNFVVLPAALDLAAPNGSETREAFAYLNEMHRANPDIFEYIDAWNSHSYPNPAFSSSPQRTGKNSLRGFQHELAYLKTKTSEEFDVYITETGWEDNAATSKWLSSYYNYAMQHIWSDPQVKAVTPFVLKGSPGPFEGFSFLSDDDQPTRQYLAFRNMIEVVTKQQQLLTDATKLE